jgi:hypothetical protein
MASPACHQFRRDSTAETHRRGDPTPVSSPIQEAEKERTEKIPTQAAARRLGYADQNPPHYEDDHLISLELGGAPYSKKNLWPRPWSQAHKKDPRENLAQEALQGDADAQAGAEARARLHAQVRLIRAVPRPALAAR